MLVIDNIMLARQPGFEAEIPEGAASVPRRDFSFCNLTLKQGEQCGKEERLEAKTGGNMSFKYSWKTSE